MGRGVRIVPCAFRVRKRSWYPHRGVVRRSKNCTIIYATDRWGRLHQNVGRMPDHHEVLSGNSKTALLSSGVKEIFMSDEERTGSKGAVMHVKYTVMIG